MSRLLINPKRNLCPYCGIFSFSLCRSGRFAPTFRKRVFSNPRTCTLKMEAVRSSETLVQTY
jgi:hypothetical protein